MQGKGTYLENYLETVSTVPSELTRSLALIRELDYRSNEVVEKVESIKNHLVNNTSSSRKAAQDILSEKGTKQLKADLKAVMEYADEKVELSNQSYELIDRYIRKLDTELKKFEAEIEEQEEEKKKRKGTQMPVDAPKKGKANIPSPANNLSLHGRKKASEKPAPTKSGTSANNTSSDLEIDPNEPTYCICGRVSFGEMIECESGGCKIEWFHFECVGLSDPPKGKWICPDCIKRKGQKNNN
ncbi:PHD zinc finger-containing protein [Heterostelium album PN500]|uniref:Inhibitor of growth protein n=1 Tax=Heterostelium pallidum (strain ATCC 26659 / Pp 5 / PN500) TaxID=670386 RepID=D3BPV0_HETP5|nr:PHD zinc finger-containing protein [Heterostelium album PN500]EFA76233.1 PHD zinc finger-containing protein [Heterostelium album PN500]|eukprot:XP_020428366.1 PHD zinc finger-containing protein [Heterostelium album PN500]